MTIKETFQQLVSQYSTEENKWEGISFRFSVARITLFVLTLFLIVYFANERNGGALAAVALMFPVIFALVVRSHNKVIARKELAGNLRKINEEEVSRQDHKFDGLPTGEYWLDKSHPYAYDLDIFGRNSLFQLINRTSTPSGEYHLARWLLSPADPDRVRQRQESVQELSGDLAWNQRFQASGRLISEVTQAGLDRLLKWLKIPAELPAAAYRYLSWILPALILVSGLLVVWGMLSIYVPLLLLLVNGFLLRRFQDQVTRVTHSTSGNARLLRSYATLIRMIEERTFRSDMLSKLKEPFHSERASATRTIHRLRRLADYLDARGNLFYQLFNFLFLLDIHLIVAAQRWKRKNHEDIAAWFSNIGEAEALISLAGLAIAQPAFHMPELRSGQLLKVQELGHPLIPPKERVVNDFEMEGPGRVVIITGSNMSGKSTFLRTAGINVVMAHAGAPVCARAMSLSAFRVFTGMRTEDNLEAHISSFYAELKRIRQLLDYMDSGGAPVLFMLDEVLKGTNTKDRHKGSAALITKLLKKNGMGFVSTHDLELGNLAEEHAGIRNYSFNSEIRENEIIFDYKIAAGICHSFNASMLMKKIGILDNEN